MSTDSTDDSTGAVRVRRATARDAAAVAALVAELAAEEAAAGPQLTSQDWRRLLTDARVTVLLAHRDTDVVGQFSSIEPGRGVA